MNNIPPFIYYNLYEYDIKSCFFNILKNIDYENLNLINTQNKLARNTSIGLLQKNNPILSNYLHTVSNNLIDSYIKENSLNSKNIILRNKDGIITDVFLKHSKISLELSLRACIDKMIVGRNGHKLILYKNTNTIRLLGRKPYFNMKFFYDLINIPKLDNISYTEKLSSLKNKVLVDPNVDIKCFLTLDKKSNQILVPFKNGKIGTISKSFLTKLGIGDIDRKLIWEDLYNFIKLN